MSKFDDAFDKILEITLGESIQRKVTKDDHGRTVIKYFSSKKGYRIKSVAGKPVEVRITPQEHKRRSAAAKKSALKRKKRLKTPTKRKQTKKKTIGKRSKS